jgi:hypothetical protein
LIERRAIEHWGLWNWMRLQPQRPSADCWINPEFYPPSRFISTSMQLAMMTTAERDRELIADLAAESRRLCKTEMMRISGKPAANQARLLGDRFHMLAVANSAGQRQRQDRFVDTRCPIPPSAAPSQRFECDCRLVCHKGREL